MIRLASPVDAQAIHELKLAAFSPFRQQYTPGCFDATVLDERRIIGRMREGPIWVFSSNDEIQATVSVKADEDGLYIRGMAVHPGAQRQGIGVQLLARAEAYAQAAGCQRMWLSTTEFLHESQKLYTKFGFRPATGPPDLHGVPLVSFEKAVNPA